MKVSTVFIALSAVVSSRALAADDDPATKKEVAELRQEVRDLRRTLARVLEIEEQRLAALKAALSEQTSPASIAKGETSPSQSTPVTTAPSGPRRGESGTVTGRVSVTGVNNPIAYVYIEDIPGRLVTGKSVELKQQDKKFVPSAIAIQKGTKVVFPNQDKIFHNVFSVTPGSSFDLGSYAAGTKPGSYVFTQPGAVDVFCNLHSQMTASVLVVPNGYFAKVGPDGRFQLKDVPPGKHKLVAWTPNVAPVSEAVTVGAGSDVEANLSIQGRDGVPDHKDKKGMPYGSYQ